MTNIDTDAIRARLEPLSTSDLHDLRLKIKAAHPNPSTMPDDPLREITIIHQLLRRRASPTSGPPKSNGKTKAKATVEDL